MSKLSIIRKFITNFWAGPGWKQKDRNDNRVSFIFFVDFCPKINKCRTRNINPKKYI